MPIWSWNQLYLVGNKEELLKFYKENLNNEGYLDFELSVPTDDPITDWGTKWNAVQDEYPENYEVITLPCDDNDNRLEYEFKTAWCPPYKYTETVSKKYNNIEFELSTDRSSLIYKDGIIIDEIMYSDTDDSEPDDLEDDSSE